MKAKKAVQPTRRDLTFNPPAEHIHDWLDGGVHFTHLMNTMSLVIPVGERFFIDAVRHYRDQITDPELKKAATAFIGQEAMHGREHDEYNGLMHQRVPVSKEFEDSVTALLAWGKKNLPASSRLSATIALEHLTAIMADGFLTSEFMNQKSEKHYGALWKWHALEETEHKGVPYDIYEQMVGTGPRAYAERTLGPGDRHRDLLGQGDPGAPVVRARRGQAHRSQGLARVLSRGLRRGGLSCARWSGPGSATSSRASIPGTTTTATS